MRKLLFLLLSSVLGSQGLAQNAIPGVTVTTQVVAPPTYQLAQHVIAQPEHPVAQVPVGYTTATLSFSLLSEMTTQVVIRAEDPRLIFKGSPKGQQVLTAYNLQTLNFIAMAPHSGFITISNTAGTVLARVPYTVAPTKTLSQNLSFNYSPTAQRAAVSYSLSGLPASPIAPVWSMNANVSYGPFSGVGSSVGVNVRW